MISLREKGDGLDYCFMPEPNLPRLQIPTEWINKAKKNVKRDVAYLRFIENFQFPVNFSLYIMVGITIGKTIFFRMKQAWKYFLTNYYRL